MKKSPSARTAVLQMPPPPPRPPGKAKRKRRPPTARPRELLEWREELL